jgi:hypothetical protein
MLRSELSSPPNPSFANGLFTGIAAAAVLVHVWFAVLLAPLRETYAEFTDSASQIVPCLTWAMIHPAWLWGVPAVGAALVVALIVRRPARRGPYIACAALLLVTLVATWVLTQTPLRRLADDIRPDDGPAPVMQLVPTN